MPQHGLTVQEAYLRRRSVGQGVEPETRNRRGDTLWRAEDTGPDRKVLRHCQGRLHRVEMAGIGDLFLPAGRIFLQAVAGEVLEVDRVGVGCDAATAIQA